MEQHSHTSFNRYPINRLKSPEFVNELQSGIDAFTAHILTGADHPEPAGPLRVCLDGTHGAHFKSLTSALEQVCIEQKKSLHILHTAAYLKPEAQLREEMARYLTDNRAFGYTAQEVRPMNYFREDALAQVQQDLNAPGIDICVLAGPGAALLTPGWPQLSYYIDLSRENQQLLHSQGMGSFGLGNTADKVETYKDCYFLQWPVWEPYRRDWLHHFGQLSAAGHEACYMDLNRDEQPVFLPVTALHRMLDQLAGQPFRVKPFFAPGIWGGQYLKELCDLPKEWDNCAWGFEPIAPENTLLIGVEDQVLELPFPLLMEAAPSSILGTRNAELFGDYFPIRFDFLDTMDGGRLSVQVHPQQQYIEQVFNEHMTQQESYYVMEHKPGSTVYLGLTTGTTKDILLDAVEEAHATSVPLDVPRYVNEYTAEKGALYLIPPGTVHCSGQNNLVLEISSTPWWFTFKIYDYLRRDADGKPRPMNPGHARQNIKNDMDTQAAENGLIPKPVAVRRQGDNLEELLGQREDLLFQVKRLKLTDVWTDDTNGEFVMFNLVEGQRVRLIPLDKTSAAVEWGYAEAYIVPASLGPYRLENASEGPCTLIAARVSPEWNHPLLPFTRALSGAQFQ
ncbi:class I mannose-6-phosphate isomerase [Paenibacillus sp. JSM ZJ436]|uniref:class I mannose-6-phosphate isomerase n=1 Tax=Paenibacillus sp. JSM ZJ436 TaxID=3376190 RepID=UPI0037A0604A